MGIYCDRLACYHVDSGKLEDLKRFITPNDPHVVALAKELGNDPRRMYEWVQAQPYGLDKGETDPWSTPVETLVRLNNGEAPDCLDRSALLCSLLIHAGKEAWVAVCYVPSIDTYHAFVEVINDGKTQKLETTWPLGEYHRAFPNVKVVRVIDFNDVGVLKKYES